MNHLPIPGEPPEKSKLNKMRPHVPGIVTFANHSHPLPFTVEYHSVVIFVDISGFTALCETYSVMGESGVDQLTRTLNEFLSALVEGVLNSDGDILKFAGDAILAIWRVGRAEELENEIIKVVRCCLDMQRKCGKWDTDIGVQLTVKIGLAAGMMSVTFLGNNEYRHYVELGPAIKAVNAAEHLCLSGMVVASPDTWLYCDRTFFELEQLDDGKHVKILSIIQPNTYYVSLPGSPSLINRAYFDVDGHKRFSGRALSAVPSEVALIVPLKNNASENIQSTLDLKTRHGLDSAKSHVKFGKNVDGHKRFSGRALSAVPSEVALIVPLKNNASENIQSTLDLKTRHGLDSAKSHVKFGKTVDINRESAVYSAILSEVAVALPVKSNETENKQSTEDNKMKHGLEGAHSHTQIDSKSENNTDEGKKLSVLDHNATISETALAIPEKSKESLKHKISSEDCKTKQVLESPKTSIKMASKPVKLKNVVTTVKEMKLDHALRLYILSPVLKKLDDNQPLDYLSELRQVSIVFMNLVLQDEQDSEKILQEVFELVYAETKTMQGSLNKVFLFDKGCTFLVIFGLPGYKHEDDCIHALMCADRMKSQLDRIDGVQRVSVGVTTGVTFCGVVGHPKRHEYSVIGRKVNMAARLMMNYPENVTCDSNTYDMCRLPPSYFEVLVTKQLKGLKNVGIIRRFIGFSMEETTLMSRPIMHSDNPILGRHMEELLFREQIKLVKACDNKRSHLVFSGASGIGKTRLLDWMLTMAMESELRVVSCRVELEDGGVPYFVANNILRMLLWNKGFSHQIDKDMRLIEIIGNEDSKYLYLLNDMLSLKIPKPKSLLKEQFNESFKRKELLQKIFDECVMMDSKTVILIDDAHNMDTSSWEFLCDLLTIKLAVIVISLRPAILDAPTCHNVITFTNHQEVTLVDLSSMELKHMAPLACQLMCVVSIPRALEKIIRELCHGVPSWCMAILRNMLELKQLIIVLDDGRPMFRNDAVTPNKAFICPQSIRFCTPEAKISELHFEATKVSYDFDRLKKSSGTMVLSDLGYLHAVNTKATMLTEDSFQPSSAAGVYHIALESHAADTPTTMDRIAIFNQGIDPSQIPIPPSMTDLIIARLDSMRATDELTIKCASVLDKIVRRDILELLLPKAHRPKLILTIRRLMETGIFQCSNVPKSIIEHGSHKYRCFCSKDDKQSKYEMQICPATMFTHHLLQETAYELLIEAQRVELHSKAALCLELDADDLRQQIPYYVLCHSPVDDLKDLVESMEKYFHVDTDARIELFISKWKKLNRISQEEIRIYRLLSRHVLPVNTADTTRMVQSLTEGAQPLQSFETNITKLLNVFETQIYHWKSANQHWRQLLTLVDAISACIAIQKYSEGSQYVSEALILLEHEQVKGVRKGQGWQGSTNINKDYQVICGKVHRLHGQILYQCGNLFEAHKSFSRCADFLGLKQESRNTQPFFYKLRLKLEFVGLWSLHYFHRRKTNAYIREQGYLLTVLYEIDRTKCHIGAKLTHALLHFNKVLGRSVEVHQMITAYLCMIECCIERGWTRVFEKLNQEMLIECCIRKGDLYAADRSILGSIEAQSCRYYMLCGQLQKAYAAGCLATEIIICIKDVEAAKTFMPCYFLVCLYRKRYVENIELLQQIINEAHITDDDYHRLLFHTVCLEIAAMSEYPPVTTEISMVYIADNIGKPCYISDEGAVGYYAAMTAAMWCAMLEKWNEAQEFYLMWNKYKCPNISFLVLLAQANKLLFLLMSLSRAIRLSLTLNMDYLKKQIEKEFVTAKKNLQHIQVLTLRITHLEAYYYALQNDTHNVEKLVEQALQSKFMLENVMEIEWMKHNESSWKQEKSVDVNKKFRDKFEIHDLDWTCQLEDDKTTGSKLFTLPLP